MSLLAVQGGATGTGTVTLLAPITNTNQTLTLPDATDTVAGIAATQTLTNKTINASQLVDASVTQAKLGTNVAGNGPAFSAYASGTTSVSNATWTKVNYATEDFDTNNNFASSRFTPTVAGYYQITCSSNLATSNNTLVSIYKNGASNAAMNGTGTLALIDSGGIISKLIYFNGSSDYVEVYVYQNTGGPINSQANQLSSWFTGSLVRAA
jgi:hypothetical protein